MADLIDRQEAIRIVWELKTVHFDGMETYETGRNDAIEVIAGVLLKEMPSVEPGHINRVAGNADEKQAFIDWLNRLDSELVKNIVEGKEGIEIVHDDGRKIRLVPEKTGKWKFNPNGVDWGIAAWTCSKCGSKNDNIPAYVETRNGLVRLDNPFRFAGSSYCPCCGARMVDYE